MNCVHVFVDTNVLLHYRKLDQIDWLGLCHAEKVTLVICMPVIDELDDKKHHPYLGARASAVIKSIREWRCGEIRVGVSLIIYADDFDPQPSVTGDERIAISAKRYSESVDPNVVVCSEDYGMELRCESQSLKVIRPDVATRLPSEQSEEAKKIATLVKELTRVKATSPELKLTIVVPDENEPAEVFRCVLYRNDLDPALLLKQEASARGVEELKPPSGPNGSYKAEDLRLSPTIAPGQLGYMLSTPSPYAQKMAEYLNRQRQWVIDAVPAMEKWQRSFPFEIFLTNIGGSPATNVEMILRLPPIFFFVKHRHWLFGNVPQLASTWIAPEFPSGVNAAAVKAATPVNPFAPLIQASQMSMGPSPKAGKPWASVKGNGEEGFEIRVTADKLVQHRRESLGQFMAGFNSWDVAKPFQADLEISAEEIPRRLEEKIHFVIAIDQRRKPN